MRYRKLDVNGDMVFGQQQADFHINSPLAVAQAVATRLRLQLGDWFLDTEDGTDWKGSILGNRTGFVRDATIRARVIGTVGVNDIRDYSSGFEPNSRRFAAQMALETIYGRFQQLKVGFTVPMASGVARIPQTPQVVAIAISDTSIDVTWS